MPEVSVYLPDELYAAARANGLSISTLAQEAIRSALRTATTDRWVAAVRARPSRVGAVIETADAVHAAREEFGG